MPLYRVFVEDVGVKRFSAFGSRDMQAGNPLDAIFKATGVKKDSAAGIAWIRRYGSGYPMWYGKRLIALPHSRKDLWPNGKTGRVPSAALLYNTYDEP